MATKLKVLGDHLWIGKSFLTGKDQIELNGQRVVEGKITPEAPAVVTKPDREYRVTIRPLSKMMGTSLVDLEAYEGGQQVLAQTFDQFGKPVTDVAQAKQGSTAQIIAIIFAVTCGVLFANLSRTWDALPGGIIGGAIAGGIGGFVGGLLGAGVAKVLTRRK